MKKRKKICIICAIILLILFLNEIISYYSIYVEEQKEIKVIQSLERTLYITEQSNHTVFQESRIEEDNRDLSSTESTEATSEPIIWNGDCIVYIPDIQLKKIVYTGKNREEHLSNYELITANEDMYYENGGNYIICGHASRLYGHSLNRIREVKEGTVIEIKTPDNTDEYIVNSVTYQNMNQTSNYCNQTTKRCITIISCAKYVSKESYIVIQASLKQ